MKLTPLKAIRVKCRECCNWSLREVRLCTCTKCPLYPYRMGHRPKEEDLPTEETNGEKTRGYVAIFE
jgi:hypothetical protein